jgi:hypothetical protein
MHRIFCDEVLATPAAAEALSRLAQEATAAPLCPSASSATPPIAIAGS